jgi:hypothetical protein
MFGLMFACFTNDSTGIQSHRLKLLSWQGMLVTCKESKCETKIYDASSLWGVPQTLCQKKHTAHKYAVYMNVAIFIPPYNAYKAIFGEGKINKGPQIYR